jgi:hypothetical protein
MFDTKFKTTYRPIHICFFALCYLLTSCSLVFVESGLAIEQNVGPNTVNPKKVCLTSSSRILRKANCGQGETELASNKVKNKKLKARRLSAGNTELGPVEIAATANAGNGTLIGAVGQSLRSYTYALTFDSNWTGEITTSCSEYEIPITATAVGFQGESKLPTGVEQQTAVGEVFFSGTFFGYLDTDGNNTFWAPAFEKRSTNTGRIFDASTVSGGLRVVYNIPSNITMYVTQVCAPLTELVAK